MNRKILIKDSFQAITHSLGRYIAIILLIGLGTFAFVGLKMTGPDMRATGRDFFRIHNLADVTITSNYGLNKSDQKAIKKLSYVKQAKFGYFEDSEIKHSKQTIRVFSNSKDISSYELIRGSFPKQNNQIALSYLMEPKFKLGQKITLTQNKYLKYKTFKIVGFVKSSEYIDKSQIGQTTIGNGRLTGLGVVTAKAFNAPVKEIGRVTFKNTAGLSPFSIRYRNNAYHDQQKLQTALNKQRKKKWQHFKNIAQAKVKAKVMAKIKKSPIPIDPRTVKIPKIKLKMAYPKYQTSSREDNVGYATYRADSQRVEILANVFPVFLYAVAALVCLSTMMRFVEEERISIGTLKALGYSNLAVSLKFVLYSTSAAFLGVILGSSLGYTFLPNMIIRAYLASSTLGRGYELNFVWWPALICLVVALISTTLVTILTLSRTLHERPAALLLPKPPKNGSRILLEHITPLWRHMNFSAKVTARNIFRYKSRMLMTIFGVAGCTGLLVMGFGIRDSLTGITAIQYGQVQKNDIIALENNNLSQKEKNKITSFLHKKEIKRSTPIHYEQLTKHLNYTGATENVMLIAPKYKQDLRKFINLRQRTNHKKLNLPDNGVVISEKLANLMKVKKGDTITLKTTNHKNKSFKVSGICEMYINHYIFMNPREYRRTLGKKYTTNAYLVTMKKKSQVDPFSRKLVKLAGIQTIIANSANRQFLNNFTGNIDTVIIILIFISSLLAIVVIYNLTNINVAERIRELSTIKVLGFYDNEVTMYIYRETIILSLIGIIVGFGCGWWLHQFIILNLPPDQAMFDPNMYPLNFVISALIPATITGLLAIFVHQHIKRINMLDALQSVD